MKKIFASLILNKATENLIEQAAANQGAEVSTNPEVVSSAVDFQKELDALGARQQAQDGAGEGAGDGFQADGADGAPGSSEDGLGGAGGGDDVGGDFGAGGDSGGVGDGGASADDTAAPPAEGEQPAEQPPESEQAPAQEPEATPEGEGEEEQPAADEANQGDTNGEQEQGQAEQASGDEETKEEGSDPEEAQQFTEALERASDLYRRVLTAHQFGTITAAHEAMIGLEMQAIGSAIGVSPVASISSENEMSGNSLRETGRRIVEFIRAIIKRFLEWARKAYGAAREFINSYNKQRADMKKKGIMGALRDAIEGKSPAEVDAILAAKTFPLPFYGPETYDTASLVAQHDAVFTCLLELAKHPHFISYVDVTSKLTDNISKLVAVGAPIDAIGQMVTSVFQRDVLSIDTLRENIGRMHGGRFVQNRGRDRQGDSELHVSLPGGSELSVSPLQGRGLGIAQMMKELQSLKVTVAIGTEEGKLSGVTTANVEELAAAFERTEAKVAAIQAVVAPFGDGAFGDLTKHIEAASNSLTAQAARGTYQPDDVRDILNLIVLLGQYSPPKIFSLLTGMAKLASMYQSSLQGVIAQISATATQVQSSKD